MRSRTIIYGVLATAAAALPAVANDDVKKAVADPNNWAMQQGNYEGWRYSKLDQINTQNVKDIKVAWQFSTGVLRGHEGSPIVIGKDLYLHSAFPNKVFKLSLENPVEPKILWKYEPKQDPSVIPVMCCDTVNRGPQVAGNTLIMGLADTTLVALDTQTGKEKWKQVNGDPKKGETYTGTLMIIRDKVIMGNSGAEFGVRGHVTAYGLNDGKRLWRAYSVGPDSDILVDPQKTMSLGKPVGKDSSLKTWTGDQWKIGGGSTWGYYAYDEEANLFYYGTANPSTWNPAQRAGPDGKRIDQKWSMTLFARNPDTGVAVWAYQMTPFDEWDYDGVNESILTTQNIGGEERKVLTHFDRNGFGYTIDRLTGEPLVAQPYDQDLNWSSGVDLDKKSPTYGRPKVIDDKSTFVQGADVNTKNICPAALGFKDQQPAAYSPQTNLFYIPVPVGCDTDSFVPRDRNDPRVRIIRESLGVAPDEIMILTAGGDAASKGAQEVMQALAMIDKKVPSWKYVCKVWPQPRTEIQNRYDLELAEKLGIADRVVYTMNVISRIFMPYLLAACDIYAAPSRLEGFGMLQVEANACGRPVLAMNAMGMADTLIHGQTAYLAGVGLENRIAEAVLGKESGFKENQRIVFPQPRIADYRASVPDLAEHLERLMLDPALRERMGAAGRERAVQNFDYRVVSRQFVDLVSSKLGIK